MAKQSENEQERLYELQELRPEVDNLLEELDALADNSLADERERTVLAEISKVLEQIKAKIAPRADGKEVKDDVLLPRSKREELHNLVGLLRAALVERGAASPPQQQDAADQSSAGDSSSATTMAGCIPCTPRLSKQQQSKKQQPEQGEKDEGGVSLTLLLRLSKNVLEPEQYYEWTTSYVDEERIYGWDKEAGEVIDALVAPDGDGSDRKFRAAGIAGIHGSGKTALAQKVFVHDKAKDNFALRLWVCVGPPEPEDRFNLLYRMLDNLGLDTAKVEDIVDKSKVVTDATAEEKDRLKDKLHKEAAETVAKRRADAAARPTPAGQNQAVETAAAKKETPKKEEGSVVTEAGAGAKQTKEEDEEVESVFQELLKKALDKSRAIETSKIGVLLYILNMTLSKTSYMIVFDDIRAYRREDGDVYTHGCWYSNLTLPPPAEGEWGDRLAYGLPKGPEHRGAVLVTCRKEDDAKTMARTGLVVRPPKLGVDDAWKLFSREYEQAKEDMRKKEGGKQVEGEDKLLEQLEEMKEDIVNKCLGLPVAIIEAARGFAGLDPLPSLIEEAKPAPAAAGGHTGSSKDLEKKQLPEEADTADGEPIDEEVHDE